MNFQTLERICQLATEKSNHVIWIWHGGEPLTMPIEFYRKAQSIFRKYGINKVNIQSNGTLLNDKWIDMLQEFNWSISISFDGVSNDTKRGGASKVLDAIQKLEKHGKNASFIKVVDSDNIDNLCSDYQWFKEIGIKSFQFNRVFKSPGSNVLALDEENKFIVDKYFEEYSKLLYIWMNDDNPLFVRNFSEFIGFLIGSNDYLCSHRGVCVDEWFGINPLGQIYPCDRWYPEEFSYGNIHDFSSFDEVRSSPVFIHNNNLQRSRKEQCAEKGCEIVQFCNGGCNAEAILYSGGKEPNSLECDIKKGELAIVYNAIKNLDMYKLKDLKNAQLRKLLVRNGLRSIDLIKKLEGIK